MPANLALLAAYIIFFAFLHSLTAANFFKAGVKRALGEGKYERYYRFFYVLLSGITLLPLIWLWLIPRKSSGLIYAVPFPYAVLFYAVMLSGIGIALAAGLQLEPLSHVGIAQLFGAKKEVGKEEKKALITGGAYGISRHPMYLGGMLLLWGNPNMYRADIVLNLLFTAYFAVGALLEEKKLVAEFGEEYENYKKEVPMFVPKLKRQKT